MKVHISPKRFLSLRYIVRSIYYLFLFSPVVILLYVLGHLVLGVSLTFGSSIPAEEEDNMLKAISAVITGLGIVGFALSYINSAKAFRVKGILLEDVISKSYHLYGVSFVSHTVLALLGLYSCNMQDFHSSQVCLFGILLCTIYSSYMAFSINFSQKHREWLISRYLYKLPKALCSDAEGRRIANQIGLYIGEHVQADDFQLDRATKEAKKDNELLQSALTLMETAMDFVAKDPKQNDQETPQPEEQQSATNNTQKPLQPECRQSQRRVKKQNNEANMVWDGPLPEIFDRNVFPGGQLKCPEFAVLLPPSPWSDTFRLNILHYATFWDNLLRPVERDGRQAKLAADILLNATATAPLCCGLILHLHTSRIQHKNSVEDWLACMDFLNRISHLSRISPDTDDVWHIGREKVLRCCLDAMFLFTCLACLQEANSEATGSSLSTTLINIFLAERQKNTSPVCDILINAQCFAKYLYFAHMIFLLLAIPGVKIPYRLGLYQQIPSIASALEQYMQINISEKRSGGMEYGATACPYV